MKNVISRYFNTNDITTGLLVSFLLSAFIYFEYFNLTCRFLNTLLALLGLFLLLNNKKETLWFWSGFFTALLWFWWIPLSFRIYGIAWAIPFGTIGISFIYGIFFLLGNKLSSLAQRYLKLPAPFGLMLFLLVISHIAPLGFDWFKLQLLFYIAISVFRFGSLALLFSLLHFVSIKEICSF